MTDVDFVDLWHSHHAKISSWVRYKLGEESAEDVTQEIFERAFAAMKRGAGYTEHASGWLWQIARNKIIDCYRARERQRPNVELDALLDVNTDTEALTAEGNQVGERLLIVDVSLDEIIERRMIVESVRVAVDKLPTAKQTDVIELRLEGYTYGEIAEILNTQETAVKMLGLRAYAHMRPRLQEIAA